MPAGPADEIVMEALRAVVRAAYAAGCPIAGDEEQAAGVALRRWRSFPRRSGRRPTDEARVEDLAKGLRQAFEPDPKLAGPLMEDYRWLAARLANVLRLP